MFWCFYRMGGIDWIKRRTFSSAFFKAYHISQLMSEEGDISVKTHNSQLLKKTMARGVRSELKQSKIFNLMCSFLVLSLSSAVKMCKLCRVCFLFAMKFCLICKQIWGSREIQIPFRDLVSQSCNQLWLKTTNYEVRTHISLARRLSSLTHGGGIEEREEK